VVGIRRGSTERIAAGYRKTKGIDRASCEIRRARIIGGLSTRGTDRDLTIGSGKRIGRRNGIVIRRSSLLLLSDNRTPEAVQICCARRPERGGSGYRITRVGC